MRIVVDAMGGDRGCLVVVRGARMALQALPHIQELFLVGIEDEVRAAMSAESLTDPRVKVIHASQVLTMEDKPVDGLRKKKDCSLLRAVELVKDGRAQAMVSPGNTGGMVAASTIRLRQLEGVDRPCIATVIPTSMSEYVLLDAGANIDCTPEHLAQFAVMGSIYASEILGKSRPRVGILSNGTEDIKGTQLTREAAKACASMPINFIGYVEGHDLFENAVDVVVTDGFTGNVVLKTMESLAKDMIRLLKTELTANPLRKTGAFMASGAFKALKRRMDPEAYGGAPLLGLNGIVIKAHGSASERAIKNAIGLACNAVQHHINDLITQQIAGAKKSQQP